MYGIPWQWKIRMTKKWQYRAKEKPHDQTIQGNMDDLMVTRYLPKLFQCPNSIILYINLYLSTILRLLVMSVISPRTPTNIRSPNHITHITLYRQWTLRVRTLRVWELCRHDRDTSLVNNQCRNLDAHVGFYIFYEDLYRSNRYDNIRNPLCQSVCYLLKVRSSVSLYLVQSRYRQVSLLIP